MRLNRPLWRFTKAAYPPRRPPLFRRRRRFAAQWRALIGRRHIPFRRRLRRRRGFPIRSSSGFATIGMVIFNILQFSIHSSLAALPPHHPDSFRRLSECHPLEESFVTFNEGGVTSAARIHPALVARHITTDRSRSRVVCDLLPVSMNSFPSSTISAASSSAH